MKSCFLVLKGALIVVVLGGGVVPLSGASVWREIDRKYLGDKGFQDFDAKAGENIVFRVSAVDDTDERTEDEGDEESKKSGS
ncbi:hypothetical protein [Endothiovibrio diazotrophicus]